MALFFAIKENNKTNLFSIEEIRQFGILSGATNDNKPLKNLEKCELNEVINCDIANRKVIIKRIR